MLTREVSLERRKGRASETRASRRSAFIIAHGVQSERVRYAHDLFPKTIAESGRVKRVGGVVRKGIAPAQRVSNYVPVSFDMRSEDVDPVLDLEKLDVAGETSEKVRTAPTSIGVSHSDGVIGLDNDRALRKRVAPFVNCSPYGVQLFPIDVEGALAGTPGAADPAILPSRAPA